MRLDLVSEPTKYVIVMTPDAEANKVFNTFTAFVVDPNRPTKNALLIEEFPELEAVLSQDPVDLLTGSFAWDYTDTALYGEHDLEFSRSYSSGRAYRDNGLGLGWSHSFGTRLKISGMSACVTLPNGNDVYFARGKDNEFYAQQGSAFQFEWSNGAYHLTHRDGTEYLFDAEEHLTQISYLAGNVVYYDYDGDKLSSVANRSGRFTFDYDGDGHLTTVTDSVGRTTSFAYDGDLLTSATNTDGDTLLYAYDGNGCLTTVQNFNGEIYVQNEYDSQRRVVKQYVKDDDTYTFTYDKENQLHTSVGESGKLDQIRYDALGHIVEHTTSHILDGNGRVVETIDAMGTSTLFEYDAMGRLIKTSLHRVDTQDGVDSWEITRYQYNGRGLTTRMTDALGHVTTYTYDGDENLVSKMVTYINYNGGKQVEYAYNAVGDLVRMEDWTGVNTFEYDLLSQLKQVTDHKGNVVKYDYDGNGNQTAITYPDDSVVTYEYDGVNNLTAVTEDDGRTTTYEYDRIRRVVRMDYPHGWVEEYEYDSIEQLLRVTDSDPSGKDMKQQKHVYEYDVCGNMVYEYMRGNGTGEATVENEYDYDALHRVIRAEEHYGHEVRAYTYDTPGNVTYEEDSHNNQVDYILNDLNQITESTGEATVEND